MGTNAEKLREAHTSDDREFFGSLGALWGRRCRTGLLKGAMDREEESQLVLCACSIQLLDATPPS